MSPRPIHVDTLSEFLEVTASIRDSWIGKRLYFDPWFRGHTDSGWLLTPSLVRLGLEDDEEEMRAEFMRRGAQLLGRERLPSTEWEWYFLMQHFGAPTRLLDWTTSSLIALHFALNSQPAGRQKPTCDAAVWMLDPWWLNRQVIRRSSVVLPEWDDARPYLPSVYEGRVRRRRLPLAIDPPHIARRIAVQQSHFTVHGTASNGLEIVARRRAARLQSIVIGQKSIEKMRVDLYTAGITDTSVYPDLQGLGQELARYYTDDW